MENSADDRPLQIDRRNTSLSATGGVFPSSCFVCGGVLPTAAMFSCIASLFANPILCLPQGVRLMRLCHGPKSIKDDVPPASNSIQRLFLQRPPPGNEHTPSSPGAGKSRRFLMIIIGPTDGVAATIRRLPNTPRMQKWVQVWLSLYR